MQVFEQSFRDLVFVYAVINMGLMLCSVYLHRGLKIRLGVLDVVFFSVVCIVSIPSIMALDYFEGVGWKSWATIWILHGIFALGFHVQTSRWRKYNPLPKENMSLDLRVGQRATADDENK